MDPETARTLARDHAVRDDVNRYHAMVPDDDPTKPAESQDSLQLHGLDPNSRPQTIHRPGLLFMNSTHSMTARHTADLPPISPPLASSTPISSQLYPYHQQAFVHSTFAPPPISTPPNLYPHHVHQHQPMSGFISPPPLPPKPIVYPTINSNASHKDYQVSRSPPSLPAPPLPLPPLPLSPPPPPQDGTIVTLPTETEDSDELAMVLALSQSESVQKKLVEEQLKNQEEEDLARALAASMLPSNDNFPPPGNQMNETLVSNNETHRIQSSSSHVPPTSPPNGLPSAIPSGHSEEPSAPHIPYVAYEFGRHDKWRIPDHPGKQHDEAAPKIENVVHGESPGVSDAPLLLSSVSSLPYSMPERRSSELPEYSVDGDTSSSQKTSSSGLLTVGTADLSSSLVSLGTVLEFDDAAYARQLAAEEEELSKQSLQTEESRQDCFVDQVKSPTSYGKQNAERHRPQSGRADARLPISCTTTSTPVPTSSSTVQNTGSPLPVPNYSFPPIGRVNSYQPPENRNSPTQFTSVVPSSLGSRRGSASDTQSETTHNSSPPLPHIDRPRLHLDMPDGRRPSQAGTPQPIATTSAAALHQNTLPSAGVLNVNHFVDLDLLRGVSIGFKSPMITTRLVLMQDQMPNIISLPYTRCPPLHIQAPDWRHLLRLMARLSSTRMEPTVEAVAVSKAELKLRTVIQFVKPHPSFNDWRSVLWFTIDQPVPPSAPSASRYTSKNPNMLPWSYTLSPIPVLLRDACDTNMSKTYTIPATDTVPLPTLPITFPNLALYLQAALDTSRRYVSDSPNSLGKLAKMVQMCYPSVDEGYSDYDIPERTTVSDYIRRVIGRSNKDKKKGKGTNNEDTYQLVTPFVPDEWGG